jgi:phosphohistidine phosphatase
MKLYIMRHGPAEDFAPSGRDADRALTPSGRDRVRDVARALVEAGEAPNLILTSPLVRARQTAEIVAMTTKLETRGGTLETTHDIAPGGDGAGLVRALIRDHKKRAMIVGHEPDLSGLVYKLTAHQVEMLKGMVVGIASSEDGIRLRFVLDPKSLTWERAE